MKIFSIVSRPAVVLFFRICVGGYFVAAGAAKLSQPAGMFAAQIETYGMLPAGWEWPIAYGLPWVELTSGAFLLAGFFARQAGMFVAVQLVIFTGLLSVSILAGKAPEDCGCIPGISETPAQALVRDIVMMVWLAVSFRGLPGKYSMDRRFNGEEGVGA